MSKETKEFVHHLIKNAIKNQLYLKCDRPMEKAKYKMDYNPKISLEMEVKICVSSIMDLLLTN
jgi:hypothetical protein